jgi:hypothetical protein
VAINKFTLLLILIALHVHLFATLLSYAIGNAEAYLTLTCVSASNSGSLAQSQPLWAAQSALSTIADSIQVSNTQIQASVNSTLQNTNEVSSNYASFLAQTYNQLAVSVSGAAVAASENSTISIHDWVASSLNEAVASTQLQINTMAKALASLETAMASNSALFSNVQLSTGTNISLAQISSIDVPTDVNGQLAALAKTSDFQFQVIANNATSQINALFTNLAAQSVSGSALNLSAAPAVSIQTLCPSEDEISTYFGNIGDKVNQLRRTVLVALLCLAVAVLLPISAFDVFLWKNKLLQARALGTPGNFQDPLSHMDVASHPLVSWIGTKLELVFTGDKQKILSRWVVSYCLSPAALFVMGTWTALMIVYICESSAVHIVNSAMLQPLTIQLDLGSNSTLDSWVAGVNSAIVAAQTGTNDRMSSILSSCVNGVHQLLDNCQSSMSDHLKEIFCTANLTVPTLVPDLPINSMAIFQATYPVLNATQIASLVASPQRSASGNNVDNLAGLVDTFSYVAKSHMQAAMGLMTVWFIVLLGGAVFAWVRNRYY